MHTVIGFFSYEDFVSEIAGIISVVRVQDYYRFRNAEWQTVYVELAARREYPLEYPPRDEIYVCRFEVGGGLIFDREHRQRDRENARRALEALRQDLERRGFVVRPGTFAAAKESDAVAPGPWRFERDEQGLPVLVPDLPSQDVREWKRDGVEVRIGVGTDEFDEMDKCIDLAGCNVVVRVFLGEENADPVLAGIGLYLLGKAGVTIDAE